MINHYLEANKYVLLNDFWEVFLERCAGKVCQNWIFCIKFYPFGLAHQGYNNNVSPLGNSVAKKWKFANKELEEDLGKNTVAYEWRDYDPSIGRFNKIDRFAEKYQSMTPYHFSANNPIFFREIKGDSINVAELYKKDKDGNYANATQVKAFEAFAGTK